MLNLQMFGLNFKTQLQVGEKLNKITLKAILLALDIYRRIRFQASSRPNYPLSVGINYLEILIAISEVRPIDMQWNSATKLMVL